ncbi:MAG: hypothetical protein ACJ77A_09150 [Actinomycetota bacterium]
MERERIGRLGGWMLVLGLVVGAMLIPHVASALGSIVTIQGGGSTSKAAVTKGNQLQVAEGAPSSFREFTISHSGSVDCLAFGAVPSTKGFVVKSVVFSVIADTGGPQIALVYPNGTCSGNAMASTTTAVNGIFSFPFEPGFAVAHGKHFAVKIFSSLAGVTVYVTGYLVPSSDVPATTPVSS